MTNSFYSIVSLAPNASSHDRISIGLIYIEKGKTQILISKKKLDSVKALLGDNFNFIKSTLLNLSKKFNQIAKPSALFKENQENTLSPELFQYLSSYSNNLILFEKPQFVQLQSPDEFNNLFELLIYKETVEIKDIDQSTQDTIQRVRENLIKKVKGKIHTNFKLTEKQLPNLYFNYDLDCLGKNGSILSVKVLTFDKSEQTLHHSLSDYLSLSTFLESSFQAEHKKNEYYVIADEPSDVKSGNHKFWEKLQKNSRIKPIHSEEVGNLVDVINERGFGKLFG